MYIEYLNAVIESFEIGRPKINRNTNIEKNSMGRMSDDLVRYFCVLLMLDYILNHSYKSRF